MLEEALRAAVIRGVTCITWKMAGQMREVYRRASYPSMCSHMDQLTDYYGSVGRKFIRIGNTLGVLPQKCKNAVSQCTNNRFPLCWHDFVKAYKVGHGL